MSEQRKILVADDDLDIRGIITSTISILGYTVFEASNGDEAVEITKNKQIDLAVLDYMMPGKDGIEVCKEIKSQIDGIYIPVILLTAKDSTSDKVKAFQDGIDDYLTKPFKYEELQARIKAQLRVRDLNLNLKSKNEELQKAQTKIIEQERQILANQLAGTTAHTLGQPLSAIILNCHLLEKFGSNDERYTRALNSIKLDTKRMTELLEKLKEVDAKMQMPYFGKTSVLNLEPEKS